MADGLVRPLVEAIHASPSQAVLYISGGASQALGWLLSAPGASNTVLEVVVPYSRTSMAQLLGRIPTQYTSRQTVEELSLLAYNRALKLSSPGISVAGIGFTGSLASTQPKRGEHRFYLSTRTSNHLLTSMVTLVKGLRNREQEDHVSSRFLIKAITDACKISAPPVLELSESEFPDECEQLFDEDEQLQQVIDGQVCMKIYPLLSGEVSSVPERKIILSGSFNPLHEGHLKLMEVASSMFDDVYPCFEISAINADKPPLKIDEIKDRVKQFERAGKTVIISNQPFFYKKTELFPGSVFVIGADTAERLINPKYYGGDFEKMLEILVGCKNSGCLFLVGGRKIDGIVKVLEDFPIPNELQDMFISIPLEKFNMDISSTEIRRNRGL